MTWRLDAVKTRILQVLAWTMILAAVAVLTVAVLVPRLAGATPYTVLTGSMSPTYPPGTLVVVKPIDAADLGVGDVITYQIESGRPEVATHRIISRGVNGKGEHWFRTQGDANGAPDPEPVRAEQVKGRVWYAVPYLGRVNDLINGQHRQLVVYGAVAMLLGYAAFMFASAARGRRRSLSEEPNDAVTGTVEMHSDTGREALR